MLEVKRTVWKVGRCVSFKPPIKFTDPVYKREEVAEKIKESSILRKKKTINILLKYNIEYFVPVNCSTFVTRIPLFTDKSMSEDLFRL